MIIDTEVDEGCDDLQPPEDLRDDPECSQVIQVGEANAACRTY
jgi:hypothetical protein